VISRQTSRMPRRRLATPYLLIVAFWTMLALFVAAQTWLSMLTHGHSPLRILVYELIVWWAWAALTPLVLYLARRFPLIPFRGGHALLHGAAALVMGVAHVAFWIAVTISIRPYDRMTISEFGPNFLRITLARLPLDILAYFGIVAIFYAIDFYARANQLEQSLMRAQLHALELQIQPHFLFNTLNAVSSLVRARQNEEAVAVIAGLSDLLRYSLDHAGTQRVPLEKEAAIVRRYLEIQQIRFDDRLQVRIDIAPDARRAAVPALILQPLAENAIQHGIAKLAGGGRIDVSAFREDSTLRIEMFNSGSLGQRTSDGIGLRNTVERLRQLYDGAQRFELRESAGGVMATLTLPWSEIA
jgi:two-component system LytT family sensor kinase